MARILQVCNSDFYLGKFLAPLIRELVRRGHTVDCVCEGTNIDRSLLPERVQVFSITFPRRASPVGFARSIKSLRSIIRRGDYQCVNSHNRNASIASRIAAWLTHVPVNLYTAHGFYFHDDQSRWSREATITLEAVLARLTDFTLSQSQEDIDLMLSRGYIPRARILHIGNGIDTKRFSPVWSREVLERELALGTGRLRLGTIGRLVKGKGILDLLEAFGQIKTTFPEAQLVMVGGNIPQDISPFEREFLERARDLGVMDDVVLTGIVDNVERYLATFDVFVLPSYREGLPRALLEAMSMGIPAIATEIRGCREAVLHGETGFLYPPRDVQRLVGHLEHLLRDSEIRNSMGQKARLRATELFDEGRYVRLQADTIEELIASTLRQPGRRQGGTPRQGTEN